MWPAEDLYIIEENETVLKNETLCLIATWNVVKQHGRTMAMALCAYIDFGSLLRQAFALHKIEKDSGRRTDTWKMWLQRHVTISETEARNCCEMAALFAPYPRLRKL